MNTLDDNTAPIMSDILLDQNKNFSNLKTAKNPKLEKMRSQIKLSLFNTSLSLSENITSNDEFQNLNIRQIQSANQMDQSYKPYSLNDLNEEKMSKSQLIYYKDEISPFEKMRNKIKNSIYGNTIQIHTSQIVYDNNNKGHFENNHNEFIQNSSNTSLHDGMLNDHEFNGITSQHSNLNDLAQCISLIFSSLIYLFFVCFVFKQKAGKRIFYQYESNLTPEELLKEIDEEGDPDIHFLYGDQTFNSIYRRDSLLGEGTTGRVEKWYKIYDNGEYAVKIVDYKGDMEILKLILKEFKNHKKLIHKNIVKVYELYIETRRKTMYTIMELAQCREMFDVIHDLGSYSESIASNIFKQIVTAIHYMHSHGVCHRDLKPNNILVSDDGTIVKITDFNVSKFIEINKRRFISLSNQPFKMLTYTGTIAFLAPEIFLETEYTPAVDMWSAGVILYTMLCGYQPFQAEYLHDLIELIKEGKYEFHSDPWDKISKEAKDLVQHCLMKDPQKRYDPWKALTHPWISHRSLLSKSSIPETIYNLKCHVKRNTRARSILLNLKRNYKCCNMELLDIKNINQVTTQETEQDVSPGMSKSIDEILEDLQDIYITQNSEPLIRTQCIFIISFNLKSKNQLLISS